MSVYIVPDLTEQITASMVTDAGRTTITEVSMPFSVTTIDLEAFKDCSALTTISFYQSSGLSGVTTIGANAFQNCRALTTIGNLLIGVTSLPDYLFDNCIALPSVTLPSTLTSIGSNAFQSCNLLTTLTFIGGVSGVTTLGNGAFFNSGVTNINTLLTNVTSLGVDLFRDCTGLTNVILPPTITSTSTYTFLNCTNLVSINLNNVTSFGYGSFFNCSSLASINLSTNVALTSIPDSLFNQCSSLTSLTIPSNITTIGDFTFQSCTSLTNVYFLNPIATPDVGTNTFQNIGTPSNAHVVSLTTTDYTSIDGIFTNYLDPTICFKEGSLILTDKGYVVIQHLRKGDLVKTSKDGFKSIDMIGFKEINHVAIEDRINNQLYVCSRSKYPEVFEDLVLTGSHSILVDNFTSEKQKQITTEVLGQIYMTGDKFRLPACVDERASVYKEKGRHTIYHLALENDNYYMNYGIYANGLLVETCSKRYLKELSNVTLIE